MNIQLLYFPDCPNAVAARDVLGRSLERAGLSPAIVEELDPALADPAALAAAVDRRDGYRVEVTP